MEAAATGYPGGCERLVVVLNEEQRGQELPTHLPVRLQADELGRTRGAMNIAWYGQDTERWTGMARL